MAAGRAADLGAQVTLLEKTPRVGNKLRLTGNGRCNLAHWGGIADFLAHVPRNGSFLHNSLARFFVQDLRSLLSSLGLPTVVEPDGRVFPATNRASDVVATLLGYGLSHGVRVHYGAAVAEILHSEGLVCGVRLADGQIVGGDAVILATGGCSYPQTGSTGDGYLLAERLGHTIIPLRPGLVPLVAGEQLTTDLQGISISEVRATLYQGERRIATTSGEILFAHFGLSGPAILSLSLLAEEALATGPCRLSLDLVPSWNEARLDQHFQQALAGAGKSGYHALLRGFMPHALADEAAARCGIRSAQTMSQLTALQRAQLCRICKGFEITLSGTRPIREAMITLGGVSTKEVHPMTMASRLVCGLYFAGEVLDVAGDTGGYNLQIAFTTGYIAGESAAQALQNTKDSTES